MLNSTQENVGIPEQAHFVPRKNVQLFQGDQRFKAISLLQESISGPVQKLQSLQDEFDLPDATVAEFHVPTEVREPNDLSLDSFLKCHNLVEQIGGNGPRKNKRLQAL